ncbi:MAG: hypothetical protein GVY02_07565 [Bacteroidetes bacterium]|jgi:hypothetical protein|nr:hypothetical protein [Bacteroidota bacterium]
MKNQLKTEHLYLSSGIDQKAKSPMRQEEQTYRRADWVFALPFILLLLYMFL